MARLKAKIDWDTVELIGALEPISTSSATVRPTSQPVPKEMVARALPASRRRSLAKLILSGAAGKARARGAAYTHAQLRDLLPKGLEMLIYGWRLVVAAIEGERDISRGVELAAHAICTTARTIVKPAA